MACDSIFTLVGLSLHGNRTRNGSSRLMFSGFAADVKEVSAQKRASSAFVRSGVRAVRFPVACDPNPYGLKDQMVSRSSVLFGTPINLSQRERHTLNVRCVLSGNRVSIVIGAGISPCSCM
jgi:hypothetical protein